METVTDSHAQQHLASLMDRVARERAPVVVTRQGAENVVIMSECEFNSWLETVHLLSSPANAAHLARSIAQLDAGETVTWIPPE